MGQLEILLHPDPVLRKVASEVTHFSSEALARTALDMAETMYAAHGIGLAAPQVGISQRIVVVDVSDTRDELLTLINPVITQSSGEISSEEGCLSIPDYRETVKRKAQITVNYQSVTGENLTVQADDILAICLQHEIDHLDGILFIDHLSRLKRELFRKWWSKRLKSAHSS